MYGACHALCSTCAACGGAFSAVSSRSYVAVAVHAAGCDGFSPVVLVGLFNFCEAGVEVSVVVRQIVVGLLQVVDSVVR